MKRFSEFIFIYGCFFLFLYLPKQVKAQEINKEVKSNSESPFISLNKEKMFKPFVVLESWATYSTGEKTGETEYANREDISIRRLRFGGSGSPYSWLSYSFQLHLDRLGEDGYASTKGSYGGINIWNAYLTAKLLKESEMLNLHAGYFWAAISREYNTSPWAVGSFDKVQATWYMRKFITGTGNGIESGIGLGGLKNFDKFGISYRIGTYEPKLYENSKFANRLYTGRIMFFFGEPEQSTYKYMLSGNQWRSRSGVTLGFGGSTQSNGKLTDTTFFDTSTAYGADLLINFKGLRLDGEYFIFTRTASGLNDFEGLQWHLRAGYGLIIAGKYIEPVITYDSYEGTGTKSLFKYIGDDNTLDIGVNWYLNKDKLKLAMHYVIQEGSASSNIGDYYGISCQLKL